MTEDTFLSWRGHWVVANVHAESGGRALQRNTREKQVHYVSQMQEADAEKLHVLAGDLNLREGSIPGSAP